jgi:hypothetical protein
VPSPTPVATPSDGTACRRPRLAQELPRPRSTRGRVLLALAWLWAACVLGFLLVPLLMGHPEDVNWFSVALYTLLGIWILRRRRRLRRTVALNSEPSAGECPGQPTVSASSDASLVRRGRTSTSRTARASAAPLACTIDRWLCARVSAV